MRGDNYAAYGMLIDTTTETEVDPFVDNLLIIPLQNIHHLREIYAKIGLLIVMVYADWCFPCKSQKPKFLKLASMFQNVIKNNKIVFCVDNIENEQTVHRHIVQMVPGFFVYDSQSKSKGIGMKMELDQAHKYLVDRLGLQTRAPFQK